MFFVLSFKVVSVEGDFRVQMPLGSRPTPMPSAPLKLRLLADDGGELAAVMLNQREFPAHNWSQLQQYLLALNNAGMAPGSVRPELEVEIDCDYTLRYQHAMNAVTFVSRMRDENGQIVPLIERVKLAPPRTM